MVFMRQIHVSFIITILLCWGVVNAQVDPFYMQAFNAGKKLVLQESYEQAVERFKIAEFGLMEETKILGELYLYEALSYYHLEQFDDVRSTMKKYKVNVGEVDAHSLTIDSDLERDVLDMLTQLNYIKSSGQKTVQKPPKVTSRKSLPPQRKLTGFSHVRQLIKGKKLKEAAEQLKRLRRKYKKDPRISLLEGLYSFYSDDYRTCVGQLLAIFDRLEGDDLDEASYYLALAYYFQKNYGQSLAFYQKISNPQTRTQLSHIYKKIVNGRQADIDRLAANFSIGELDKLVSRYAGDQFLCESIFKRVLEIKGTNDSSIEPVIYGCLRFPQAVNGAFIVSAGEYLDSIQKTRSAVKLIRKFLNNRTLDEADIDVYYSLGKLLLKDSNPGAAMKEFSIVDKLQADYKDNKKYMEEINRYYKNRKK